MKWLILCNDCGDDLDSENIVGMFEAKYGMVDGDVDGSILLCKEWDPEFEDSEEYVCDECGKSVAVHKSSGWFVEAHRNEREEHVER